MNEQQIRMFYWICLVMAISCYVRSESTSESSTSTIAKRLPQAIIIGAKKCGTRALLKFIGAHPNVSTAGAETHFFDRFYHMGLDWYR